MRVAAWALSRIRKQLAVAGSRGICVSAAASAFGVSTNLLGCAVLLSVSPLWALAQSAPMQAQGAPSQGVMPAKEAHLPPKVAQAQRFLARRGWVPRQRPAARVRPHLAVALPQAAAATPTWQPLGPMGVVSANYGLVTGRVSSLAFDPSDSTGNRLYVGTTGGGLWVSQNAGTSDATTVVFTPLTDAVSALSAPTGAIDASISIGAVTVQPGGTGVILAGTGDPNDALDSYYGAGVLRSPDNGKTWKLIQLTADMRWGFMGEGFAGFAWSTVSPQTVVAAVSQAWESVLVAADRSSVSSAGLYYSTDGGATWSLAHVKDLNGQDVQASMNAHVGHDGNPATAVVWNPVRGVFVAAVRFHGYYQSADGVTWTRLAAQPGSGLTTQVCPSNSASTGSTACPIYRGALAVNPQTGDTFAWTVDLNNQDQGIWQDVCAASGGLCSNPNLSFGTQWSTTALETNTSLGSVTIENGDYNLALAAVPSGQDTLLLAGDNDLWKCSLAMGCAWRNTTHADTCMSAQVAGYQHALAWSESNPLEAFVGNDGGLWRSEDAIGETGSACASTDASHFQNLNGGIGSLAEVESMSPVGASPYTMMVGLGANGTAGVKSTTGPTTNWPEMLGGEGGPVAVDPANPAKWYVNNGAGVSIHLCSKLGACTPADFGTSPVVTNADVANDGLTMTAPAPFLVDPLDPTQLLIGTCRVWRGPANGTGWTSANAISPMLSGARGGSTCGSNALIRSLAALALPGGGEIVYVGMYGGLNGGATLPGHMLSATMDANGVWSAWNDLTSNPVTNDTVSMNAYGVDISSLFVDPHDTTGNTVYVTLAGFPNPTQMVRVVYRSIDGGAHWAYLTSNLPAAPANSLVVDPVDPNTAYIATDIGVYATQRVANCGDSAINCWFAYGTGLPEAPVVALSAAPVTGSLNVLAAATYGRGVWLIPLLTGGSQFTTATVNPTSLDFGTQAFGIKSSAQTVTLTNTGAVALIPTSISVSGDYNETDNCLNATINAGASCTIQITFTPSVSGERDGQLTIAANLAAGKLTVALTGTGDTPGVVALIPATIDFGQTQVGSQSTALQVTAENSGGTAVAITSIKMSGPFVLVSNVCGTTSLAANSDCQLKVAFAPTVAGPATGALTFVDDAGTQSTQLSGTGNSPPTDTLTPTSVTFAIPTIMGQSSDPQTVTMTNSGASQLTGISYSVTSGSFQVSSSTCTAVLPGGAPCYIYVKFAPMALGAQSGILTVKDMLGTQTVPLSGTGIAAPVITVNPTGLTFTAQTVNVASAPQSLTVTNTGSIPVANVGFQIAGQSLTSFSGTTTCGATLANGSTCTVQVIFTPSASGQAVASLTITSSTPGAQLPPAVSLTGTGQAAAGLSASPAQLTFAPQALGQGSTPQTVTIANTGGTGASSFALAVSGPFSLAQNTCGTSLGAGASCSTGVVFTPMSKGILTGALTASSTSAITAATVALSGTGGLTGAVQLLPAQVNFPVTGVGTTSTAVTVTVTNSSGAVALAELALTVSSGFKLAASTCGTSLAAGASCSVGVEFAPASAGAQTGSLSLASSVLTAVATVPLTGTGFDFTAATTGTSSQAVASGQTATFTLTLSPSSGSAATFTFQCGTLPLYAGCVFNPASETVPANTTGTETVQVTTSQAKAALTRPLMRPSTLGGWGGAVTLACGLLVLPLAGRRRRSGWMLVLLLALLVSGVSSCASSGGGGGGGGGGTNPPSGTNNTPAGTYSIPVTITSNGVQHSVSLSLVVD